MEVNLTMFYFCYVLNQIESIITEQWIQIRQFEQAFVVTKVFMICFFSCHICFVKLFILEWNERRWWLRKFIKGGSLRVPTSGLERTYFWRYFCSLYKIVLLSHTIASICAQQLLSSTPIYMYCSSILCLLCWISCFCCNIFLNLVKCFDTFKCEPISLKSKLWKEYMCFVERCQVFQKTRWAQTMDSPPNRTLQGHKGHQALRPPE